MSENDSPQREAHRYPRIVQFVRETPWAILEPKLLEIQRMLDLHARGATPTPAEIEARIGAGPARRDSTTANGVAVIPIYGVITPKADLMSEMSGGTSTDRLVTSIRAAVADPKVQTIVLDVNSPGGSVAMLTETAGEIRQARRTKPVIAVANTMAASAAYHLASQATEFVVTPSGSVGSIGTIVTHDDVSAALEMEGVKTTVVTSSKFKGELSPFAPLSDEAKATLQSLVDKHGRVFEQDVARGRGVTVETVRSDFGQGRMLAARDAVAAGMADRVDTLDNVLADLAKSDATGGARAYVSQPAVSTSVYLDGAKVAQHTGQSIKFDVPAPKATESGLTFAQQASDLVEAANALLERTSSLAELHTRHLTVTKREHLSACSEALSTTAQAIHRIVEAATPVNTRAVLLAEKAKLERSSFHEGTRT